MKTCKLAVAALSLFLLAGCASEPEPVIRPVRLGLSREDLRSRFGEPVRIERAAAGGEDWYYRFVSWNSHPSGSSSTSDDFGQRTSSVSVGWEFTRESEVRPIHVSSAGQVIEPLPEGKVVQK